ncbi:zinc finger protein 275-like [Musca domestica]|uniref:Zinc finger protein 275-like n=1 Tax=Musca domestica TaxID=7370 RepID=A0ABM3ULQ2_MUSDO|nr:zinc finger protein 275-like [Musca domestica]
MHSHKIYGRICRVCMSNKKNMFNTQSTRYEESDLTIEEMLLQTTPQLLEQQRKQSFPVPQEICKACMDQLLKAFKFQRLCLTTHDLLYKTWSASVLRERGNFPQSEVSIGENASDTGNNIETDTHKEISGNINDNEEEASIAAVEDVVSGNGSDNDEEDIPLSSLRKLQKSINEKYNQIEGAIIKTFGRNQVEKESDVSPLTCDSEKALSAMTHQCNTCLKNFTNATMLQKHKRNRHKESEIEKTDNRLSKDENSLDNCDLDLDQLDSSSRDPTSSEKEETDTIVETNKTRAPHPCPQCKATFRFEKQMERHLKKHTDAHRFVCMVCHDRFKYPFMLQKHNEKHHPDENKNKTRLMEDKKEPLNKSYTCNHCPAAYTNVGGLAQHMSKKHSEIVPFKCDKCNKTFVVEEHLKIHTNRHMGIKNFQCELCDKSFSFKFAMKQHMRIHTGDLNYLCTLCGKKFYRPSNLRQHMQRHGDDKPYSCPHCPKRFKCPSDRYIHLMSHQQGKNHVCSTCGARFSRVDTLHQHVKVLHSGEKPYKCDQCPMAFPRLMNLNRHRRTHTGEKPYKCKYCDKAYAQSNDLNKHLRTHVGENTYMCSQCPMAFKYQADLRNHEWDHYRKEKEAAEQQSQTKSDDARN